MEFFASENGAVELYLQIASNHIIGYHSVISQLSTKTRDELDDIVKDAEQEFMIYLIVLCVFVLGCLALAIWYVSSSIAYCS